jgi:medium-chain acyl-[acyl-carrier-protein] hydrolase
MINSQATAYSQRGKQTVTPWLIRPKPRSLARLRLFCFHYAGGGPHVFREWVDKLPVSVDVCPVQLPGRGARLHEAPYDDLPALIQALHSALRPYLEKPYAFFGHSMGSILSFELAHQIRRENDTLPVHLFLSGRSGPQKTVKRSPICGLPEAEFITELGRYGGTPEELLGNFELMKMMMPTLRADFSICENYRYSGQPPLNCSISAFGSLEDPDISREGLEAWRLETTSSFSVHMFPGNHFYLQTAQRLLLQVLSREMYKHLR